MTKTNTKLTKVINGRTVQLIMTIDGETEADWTDRFITALKQLENQGWERSTNTSNN